MNEMFIEMFVLAVSSGRLTIDFIPERYREEVRKRTREE